MARDYVRAHKLRAADVMSRDLVSVDEDAGVGDMARLLEERHIKRLPVVRGGRMVGIVTRGDVIRGLGSGANGGTGPGDADLRERILAALAALRLSPRSRVSVVVTTDAVHLWGAVASPEDRQRLIDNVAAVEGAPRVVNHFGGR